MKQIVVRSVSAAAGIGLLFLCGQTPVAQADEYSETCYDPEYCGGAHGTPAPTFSPFTDLPYVLGQLGSYTADPSQLFGPYDRWTNWYEEFDMRNALAKLAVMRGILDAYNLWDMYLGWFPDASCPTDADVIRQVDGTCNDLDKPAMGAAGIRFGRNIVPFDPAAHPPYDEAELLEPNPRTVSRTLFTRGPAGTKEVPFLNMLAAAWVQFQVHDWFSHGENSATEFFQVPLEPGDPMRRPWRKHMVVPKTSPDPSRQPWEGDLPPSYQNEVTHWWDASQIYGSDIDTANRLRSFSGGRLKVNSHGLIPTADGFEDTGFRRNWWLGLALLHNLFVNEHNAIAAMLADAYPSWTDQQIYDRARMINAAVIAKIHTIEWTPAILPNPALEVGMNANWSGLNKYMDPQLPGLPPGVPASVAPVLFGVVGGDRDLKVNAITGQEVPYSLTEEFVSVYRMHTLIPDIIKIRSTRFSWLRIPLLLKYTRDQNARHIENLVPMHDLLYTFGVEHPGGLVLENYPEFLQNLELPVGNLDIGAIDVLRDRERGIPRYNEFRRQLRLVPLTSIEELTPNPALQAKLHEVYGDDAEAIERVDLLVGTLAEGTRPTCYGFGETLFQVFTVMATRRLQADRFYTDSFTPEVYTPEGMAWIDAASMKSVLLRHHPELASTGLADVTNAFYPWE